MYFEEQKPEKEGKQDKRHKRDESKVFQKERLQAAALPAWPR